MLLIVKEEGGFGNVSVPQNIFAQPDVLIDQRSAIDDEVITDGLPCSVVSTDADLHVWPCGWAVASEGFEVVD